MNKENLTIFDIATIIGLMIPKNILDHLVNAYGKKQTIDILSETVGYKIDKFNIDIYNYANSPETNLLEMNLSEMNLSEMNLSEMNLSQTKLPDVNSLDFKEPNEFDYEENKNESKYESKSELYNKIKNNRFRSESNTCYISNIGEDCTDEIQIVRDNFLKKYLEKLNLINNIIPKSENYHEYEDGECNQTNDDYNGHQKDHYEHEQNFDKYLEDQNQYGENYNIDLKSDEESELSKAYLIPKKNISEYLKKRNFVDNLSDEWAGKYLKEDKNQSITQALIKEAYNNSILDLLHPSFVDNGKLQKAWDVIHKYELWIENINDKYWEKLENLINHEYKFIKM
jgi:hypothetical protein